MAERWSPTDLAPWRCRLLSGALVEALLPADGTTGHGGHVKCERLDPAPSDRGDER